MLRTGSFFDEDHARVHWEPLWPSKTDNGVILNGAELSLNSGNLINH